MHSLLSISPLFPPVLQPGQLPPGLTRTKLLPPSGHFLYVELSPLFHLAKSNMLRSQLTEQMFIHPCTDPGSIVIWLCDFIYF